MQLYIVNYESAYLGLYAHWDAETSKPKEGNPATISQKSITANANGKETRGCLLFFFLH